MYIDMELSNRDYWDLVKLLNDYRYGNLGKIIENYKNEENLQKTSDKT
jgi:hypothetical protein